MSCIANLHDRAIFVMWSVKVSWSSNVTPRFLTDLGGLIKAESIWIVKSCCRDGLAGRMRSSVFASVIYQFLHLFYLVSLYMLAGSCL